MFFTENHRIFILRMRLKIYEKLNRETSVFLGFSHTKSTTFRFASLFSSMYLCVVWRDEWPANIWMSFRLPPTVEIFRAVFVMKVLLHEWEQHPTRQKILYQTWNWLTIACAVVELCLTVLMTHALWVSKPGLLSVFSWNNGTSAWRSCLLIEMTQANSLARRPPRVERRKMTQLSLN